MASEYFLLRQIEKIIMTSHPHEYRYFGVDKKDTVEAFIHPSVKVGKCALKLRDRKKIFITLTEVQNCLCEGQSEKKCRLYFSLARRLNKWDCLIFILSNLQGDRRQLSNEYLEYWINQFNCSGIPPTVKQKEIISLLMASASHLISRYQKELKCFLS
ncbi:hypothetical protein [Xenorhabdus szentirmaii]|uniref:Uncharacterized protein n=1 Tax=Xenorhabdus szentirmaii DSM 16338 TaxID=1427518 RepID=W1J0C6_9GAMM|nr:MULTISPECIES: hypothetical protein [Xenorhabdus]MBD2792585.1 hypothetical protein [Xenorhabdus sp. CUL]MBD2803594.1 hypothetical protein [Xenorhabdus sp. ZM]PHM33996.1 hypothetical protein Xsze_00387 [Xenorhabdus szentirmaii DSM 16338]CDL84182.1 hypothetical protein XSR1_400020 [Xenorhabdus szentirmaii DSM 16338]